MSLVKKSLVLLCIGVLAVAPAKAQAQQVRRDARVLVTVLDPSGGAVPDATVTLVGLEDATKRTPIAPVKTTDKGLATVANLAVGRYSIQADFAGFGPGLLRSVVVKSGDNRQIVTLVLQGVSANVDVAGDRQESASERSATSFGQTVSKEEIAALSDDPAELQQELMDLVGPDAVIRVDSFEGGQLPPKSQIKSIHVTRDQFAAETENPGSTFVDIITQPGIGALSGGGGYTARQGDLDGKDLLAGAKGPSANRNFNANIAGTVLKEKSNVSLSVFGQNQFSTPILHQPGSDAQVLGVTQPSTNVQASGLADYALTRDQTLRVNFIVARQESTNQGIGVADDLSRGYSSHFGGYQVRIQEAGPIGRRIFINTRLSVTSTDSTNQSNVEEPTIILPDKNIGGAQIKGGVHSRYFQFASDLDYVRGINSWRTGILINGTWNTSDSDSNYLGTYTFASEQAFEAGQALTYTRSVGDPTVHYFNAQGAVYLQDDIRIRKTLTISPGVRYSLQTHVHDFTSAAPRFGVTWSPFKSGHTTLRASVGVFNSWLPTGAYEQTIRNDGAHQNAIIIVNPSYPDPGPGGVTGLTNKYLLGDFNLQRNVRYSAGIDQTLSPRVRFNLLYNYIHLIQQPRGENLNAPVDGVRPDPAFANIIETVTDAEIRRHELSATLNLSLVAPGPGAAQKQFNWRRIGLTASYALVHARNNSDGTFAPPPSGTPATEWGPGPADRPYRVNVSLVSTQLRNLNVNLGWQATSGSPYTLLTGSDDNGDGFVTDRPAGVGLRSLRAPGQSTVNLRVAYTLVTVGPSSSVPAGSPGAPRNYRINFNVSANNLTNHDNFAGYSGIMTSPLFMQPVFMANPRRVDAGLSINF